MRIAMIGAGYVGLVSGACFADFGHEVVCVDRDAGRIAALAVGRMPIYEPGLGPLVAANVAAGRLRFSTDLAAAVAGAGVVFIAVGTPSRRGDGHADLTHVEAAAREVARAARGFTVVVTKSTVPVGTGEAVARILAEANPEADLAVVANPEFLREGAAIEDFRRPDRIVIGLEDSRARPVMEAVYRPLLADGVPLLFTGRRTAELTKYAANAFLAMKIAFINEIADLCEATGADVGEVAHGIGLDRRIGADFLRAGPGFGGSCFPKDALALIKTGEDHGAPLRLVETVVAVNDRRKRALAGRVAAALGGPVAGRTVAVLGLTFKPDTDDLREAPALALLAALEEAGARIRAYDPAGMDAARALHPGIAYAADAYDAAAGAEALVLVTEWSQFRSLDLARLGRLMAGSAFIDLRNVYRPEEVEAHGLRYHGVGRARPPLPA